MYVKTMTKLLTLRPIEVQYEYAPQFMSNVITVCSTLQILMPNTISDSISKTKLFQVVKDQFTESSLTTVQRKYFNETRGIFYSS